jgi:dTDP-D-glucose 4,6-dehydratase
MLAKYHNSRDINDVCLALIALAKRGHPGEIYNICSGDFCCFYSLIIIILIFIVKTLSKLKL